MMPDSFVSQHPIPNTQHLRLARHAMATRFEMMLPGHDHVRLRAAGEEALDEIERLEEQLSFYRATSAISHLNARAARGPVAVDPRLFRLLRRAVALSEVTDGAFDITVAPLLRCWGFVSGSGRLPDAQELAAVRAVVGSHLIELDEDRFTIRFRSEGVQIETGW